MIARSLALAGMLAFTAAAQADLNLLLVHGADVGIDQVIADTVNECAARNKAAGLWGATGWSDPSGSYLYFNYHGSCPVSSGQLLKRRSDGRYEEIVLELPEGYRPPDANRPYVADFNNDGYLDLIQSNDGAMRGTMSLMSTGPGQWEGSVGYRVNLRSRGTIADLDDDGYLDISVQRGFPQLVKGRGVLRTAMNDPENSRFILQPWRDTVEDHIIHLPDDAPQEVKERYDAEVARAAEGTIYNRYYYLRILDLPDGYIATYGGSYAGSSWNYVIKNGEVVEVGLPRTGTVTYLAEIDGRLAATVQKGRAHGLYRGQGDGTFALDTAGQIGLVNEDLKTGNYFDEFWFVDLDEDGDTDIVMSNQLNGWGRIMENRDGVFYQLFKVEHVKGDGMWVADLDGDADLDVVVAGCGNRVCNRQNGRNAALYINQLRQPGSATVDASPNPLPEKTPGPAAVTEPAAELPVAPAAFVVSKTPDAITTPDEALSNAERGMPVALQQFSDASEPGPGPGTEPEPDSESSMGAPGMIPLPDYDPESKAWARFVRHVKQRGGKPWERAMVGTVTGDAEQCKRAVGGAQWLIENRNPAGDQFLKSGNLYENVFRTLSWCPVPAKRAAAWIAWGRRWLGEPDGSVRDSIWWSRRWARNNPANNYYHSFIGATSAFAMATGDEKWMTFLKEDRLPLMTRYYSRTPEGGSREGTGYGESHRRVLAMAKMWRDYDGTEIVPQEFIDNSIRYWTHAIAPGQRWIAVIGDHTRLHGQTDVYHRDIIDNALALAEDPEAIAIGHWMMQRLRSSSNRLFLGLILRDYTEPGTPPSALEYHAKGAGHFFARDSWADDATFVYFTAGKRDEAHQHDDQGAFAVWADNQFQTSSDSPWTREGGGPQTGNQNVVRFPGRERNIRGQTGTLEYARKGDVLTVNMDLTAVVGESWQRKVVWQHGTRSLRIEDTFDSDQAVFGFEKPGPDDQRAPHTSNATATVERTPTGFLSTIRW